MHKIIIGQNTLVAVSGGLAVLGKAGSDGMCPRMRGFLEVDSLLSLVPYLCGETYIFYGWRSPVFGNSRCGRRREADGGHLVTL